MTLPYTDPALSTAANPYFQDNSFVRGDQMRGNNEKIWANSQYLDNIATDHESRITDLEAHSLEYYLYGVDSINGPTTILSQFSTIVNNVSSKNYALISDYQKLRFSVRSMADNGGNSAAAKHIRLNDDMILVCYYASGTTYDFIIYYRISRSFVAARGSSTISVTSAGVNSIDGCLLNNGKILIIVYASTTTYKLYIFDPESESIAAASGTPTLTVIASVASFRPCVKKLTNGNVLISVTDTGSSYDLYIFDEATQTATPASGTPSISTTGTGTLEIIPLATGDYLLTAPVSPTATNLYIFDEATQTATPASGTPSISITACADMFGACGVDGNVLLVGGSVGGTAYNLYIFNVATETATPASGTASISATKSLYGTVKLLPSGLFLLKVVKEYGTNDYVDYLLFDPSSESATSPYTLSVADAQRSHDLVLFSNNSIVTSDIFSSYRTIYVIDGPWGSANRYKFPMELQDAGLV